MKVIKNILTLLTVMAVMTLTSGVIIAQEANVRKDTAAVRKQTEQQTREQTRSQAGNQANTGNSNSTASKAQGANSGGVKKIQGARPDWSKARGARPASVERPSGSRIPKGAGRPGGAKGPGRR
ncbi:MAG: hypothetical protein ACM3NP_10675 [Actinomycetota bacterium]|jgi:hypothetical protein